MLDTVAWGKEHVAEFIKMVAPPGVSVGGLGVYDDRLSYLEALELAKALGDDGKLLLVALQEMKKQQDV